jgi:pimeloyl-ACP methyl ester carboxylesterase
VPALFLAAREDQNIPYDFAADAQDLHDASRSTAKRLELVEGSDHGVALMEHPDLLALLEAFVRDPVGATSR